MSMSLSSVNVSRPMEVRHGDTSVMTVMLFT